MRAFVPIVGSITAAATSLSSKARAEHKMNAAGDTIVLIAKKSRRGLGRNNFHFF
jgi:hypothetical protein